MASFSAGTLRRFAIMTRRNFTTAVRVEIIKRATRDGVVYCEHEGCGLPTKKYEVHEYAEEYRMSEEERPYYQLMAETAIALLRRSPRPGASDEAMGRTI